MKSLSKLLPVIVLALATTACSGITTYSEGPGAYPRQFAIEARQLNTHHRLPTAPGRMDAIVYFASNSSKLTVGGEAEVEKMATALKDGSFRGSHVVVAGYTDGAGSDAKNQQLSYHRAQVVMKALIAHHVPASLLTAQGFGKANPVGDNSTAEGKALNRRVVLLVVAP